MNEQQRIERDFEHFKATGCDYPHCQRAHDKKASERFFCAAVWCLSIAACVYFWIVVAGWL